MIESFDVRQRRLLDLVLEKVRYYYAELHGTRDCHRYWARRPVMVLLIRRRLQHEAIRSLFEAPDRIERMGFDFPVSGIVFQRNSNAARCIPLL